MISRAVQRTGESFSLLPDYPTPLLSDQITHRVSPNDQIITSGLQIILASITEQSQQHDEQVDDIQVQGQGCKNVIINAESTLLMFSTGD